MAVFRIEKTKDYTVMSNHHLRNRELSLKGKGLLSLMLSLPENWDYTMAGLSAICQDGISSVRSGISELEEHGYLKRARIREANGQLGDIEYTILESPQKFAGNNVDNCVDNPAKVVDNCVDNSPNLVNKSKPVCENPMSEKPICENPTLVSPTFEEHTQSNTNKSSTKELMTNSLNINPSIPAEPVEPQKKKEMDIQHFSPSAKSRPTGVRESSRCEMDTIDIYTEIIKENIEYDYLCEQYKFNKDEITEILELIIETVCSTRKTIRVGQEDKPAELVKSRLLKVDQFHVEYMLETLGKNTTDVRNIKSYLLTTIYNAPTSIGSHYRARVNHDMYRKAMEE